MCTLTNDENLGFDESAFQSSDLVGEKRSRGSGILKRSVSLKPDNQTQSLEPRDLILVSHGLHAWVDRSLVLGFLRGRICGFVFRGIFGNGSVIC